MQNRNNRPNDSDDNLSDDDSQSLEKLILIEQGKIPDPLYSHGKHSIRLQRPSFFTPLLKKIPEAQEENCILISSVLMR